ncbi:ubiquitin-conjugating enzyme E2 [Ordospora colligata]|uniref:Ubiquitin-conjugating enzyme E2 n=1 Tax=Ordospora colligata OC4 TaxID=1354746 RepID=A0A0B2UM56_9MICR|nr:ubiquitin-conjugating enzyme E2 [Ordospora colligata OC4]KHN70438.1 ubiquitin-conjugating enzyme E2 [Ordospora colligata OC4]TBU17188.1 ubiquitin-conjugating enzyme E2 [Ordospora colligata]TBU17438.1 ubiquitin-conjugating enzyme E2 [Ordospora colligata]TBU19618.1 ubiquitin-conjugating enzyme E2 [Ordospora colligata]
MLSPGAYKRLLKEEEMLEKSADDEGKLFKAYPSVHKREKNYKAWDIYFTLGGDSLYSGRIVKAQMEFPDCYPLQPPKLTFVSRMFHPNIYENGQMCISILEEDIPDPTGYGDSKDKWAPVQNIRTILLSIVIILNEPNRSSPANVEASVMSRDHPDDYAKKVIKIAREEHQKLLISDQRAKEISLKMEVDDQDEQ